MNQEVIIGGAELGISGLPCFNADYSLSDALVDAGFDVICHATNHAMDKGRARTCKLCGTLERAISADHGSWNS